MTVIGFLAISAAVTTIASATWKVPIWVPVLLISLIELLRLWPLGS